MPKYALPEHERRFLVLSDPTGLTGGDHIDIDDLYLSGTRLRLRRMQRSEGGPTIYKLCKKYDGYPAAAGAIVNTYLTADEHGLLARLPGLPIVKRRYHPSWNDVRYALDIFQGPLVGLILSEVEAPDAARLRVLATPPWASVEVTDDDWFRGGNLATVSADALAIRLRHAAKS